MRNAIELMIVLILTTVACTLDLIIRAAIGCCLGEVDR